MPERYTAWALVFALAACAHAPENNPPRELDENEVKLDLTSGPQSNGWKRALWPLREYYKQHEGWVDLHFMIDTNGKPYEAAVIDSTGNEAFEAAALRATKKWSFDPAMLNGMPIEAGYHLRIYFTHWLAPGVRTQFARNYDETVGAIAAGDRSRAEAMLQQLNVENLREDAFAGVAKYKFEAKWGTEAGQICALRRAVATDPGPRSLPRTQFVTALQALLRLELRVKDFASALSTWDRLKRLEPEHADLTELQPLIDDVIVLGKDERAYSVTGEVAAKSSSWFYTLYKHRFQVVVASGHVSEIKLRCDRKYVSFGFDPTLYYRIADQYGNCGLELLGDPGTRFELIQS